MQRTYILSLFLLISTLSYSQLSDYKFGKGFKYTNRDSSFSIKIAFRFQSLFINEWSVRNDDFGYVEDHESAFLIRRSRLKFDGYALNPKLTYKLELGLSNRDIQNTDESAFGNASNVILDAYFNWNFYKGFSILVGQTKLSGNRERVISSGDLQFVDRSLLNSRFNLDRDMGFQLKHSSTIGKQFEINLTAALSQGEGRNVIADNMGGYEYTLRAELYPFGGFKSKGDYTGSDLVREQSPKLALGFTYDLNQDAGRNRGNLGSFLSSDAHLKDLKTGFIDMMFKYKGFSMMGEFAIRGTEDDDPRVYDENGTKVGTYFTGSALNLQAGYLFKKNYEFALRYTKIRTQNSFVGTDEDQYTIGYSRYIVGHKLKVQTDLGYFRKANKDDGLAWRLQFDFHL
jgi:phosphate-selective porin OprO/OprP